MVKHDFDYVPTYEWKPVRDELLVIIHKLQNEVRKHFTFRYYFVGSSKRNMITRDRKSTIGFDFDVNIEVNDPDEDYSAEEIRKILRNGLERAIFSYGYGYSLFGYDHPEDSTRVLTIKVKDKANACILHSCDFCIIYECGNGQQQYIRYNKKQQYYSWEYQPKGYRELPSRIEWIKKHGLWEQVRRDYLDKKNKNDNPCKHSRSIFAETVHEVWQKSKN